MTLIPKKERDICKMKENIKISAKNVNLYYGDNHALKDINMEIKKNKDINIVTAGNISMAATGDVTITGRRIDLNP